MGQMSAKWEAQQLVIFIIEIPLIGLLLLSRIPRLRGSRLQRILSARVFILSILFTIIIWTIVRNIFDV